MVIKTWIVHNFKFHHIFPSKWTYICITFVSSNQTPNLNPSLKPLSIDDLCICVEETKRKLQREYEKNKVIQDVWITKFRWAKLVVDACGKVHKVKSKVCTKIKNKEKLIAPKLDNLWKHGGRRKEEGFSCSPMSL